MGLEDHFLLFFFKRFEAQWDMAFDHFPLFFLRRFDSMGCGLWSRPSLLLSGFKNQWDVGLDHFLLFSFRGFETQWDVGFDQYETISRQVPTMVAEGNHETDWPGRRPVGANDRWADTATDSGDMSWCS